MADAKISALPAVLQQNITSTSDVLPIVNAGATKKATAYAVTYSALNASAATTFSYDATPTVGARVGVQGTGTSWIFNTPSAGNPNYASGLVIDGSYDGGTLQSEINLRALGIYSGGGYGSELSLWTSNGTAISRQVTVKNNGDVQVKNGNLIQGTAAKGVNFTANTPAAGMTSQLLNWYEEGTWTPNQGAGLTVVGAFSSSGTYTRIGRQVTINGRLNGATSIAAALGSVICTNLPFTTNGDFMGVAVWNSAQSSSSFFAQTSTIYAVEAISASPSIYFTLTYFV